MSDTIMFNSYDAPNLIDKINLNDGKIFNPIALHNLENEYNLPEEILLSTKLNDLRIIHLNIHSVPDKFDKLKILLTTIKWKPNIILLCETFLK